MKHFLIMILIFPWSWEFSSAQFNVWCARVICWIKQLKFLPFLLLNQNKFFIFTILILSTFSIEILVGALTNITQLVGHCSAKLKVSGLILCQGTWLGYRLVLVCSRANPLMVLSHTSASLHFFLPSHISKNK